MSESIEPRQPYPAKEPFKTGFLQVSDIHKLYYEESGKENGNPVIFVHGGPGGGTSPNCRTFFDPEVYRIILLDQRGAGQSTPLAELRENTTWDLVADIEKLREHLKIDKWVVFGGSWGSTLSLAYCQTHPERVKAVVLRGIFTLQRRELKWFYEDGGACMIYPDEWDRYNEFIPASERYDMIGAYYRRLTGENREMRLEAAKAWSRWELSTSRLYSDEELLERTKLGDWCLQFARIECHYFVHGGFMEDGYLLKNVDKIRHIPATIVQGRYDIVCPTETAWKLHKAWPEAELHIIQDAGHSAKESGTQTKLLDATDKYKDL
ncbi:hypothetical protein LOTGIDRAFT_224583 [Lottia gigantea]|uniref:Proline iminopeptidase n=1 Tax=Lottia gigantea TaxID=225164 RepID=V4BB07_LOTGI|nr:hypothetical protein LOTGIDRAFT_224583 [Lottia gigantea]ESP03177.1 hypothetical protein LOTGIDRAFT_224583 [Lottia gigantea]